LKSNDCAGDGIVFRTVSWINTIRDSQARAAEIGQKLPAVEEVSAEDCRDTEDDMPVGDLLEHIHVEPLPEFSHALLVTGGVDVAARAGESHEIFMAAILAFHTGKAVVQIAAIEIARDHLLDRGPPESVL
jgi:hypothetical protein